MLVGIIQFDNIIDLSANFKNLTNFECNGLKYRGVHFIAMVRHLGKVPLV